MKKISSHRDLIVWQKAMDLVVMIYDLVKLLPNEESFRLVAQTTRAAVSVPANIAEGHSRSTPKGFVQFLSIAKGSLMETETFVLFMIRLNYLTLQKAQPVLNLVVEISKMLTVLRKKLNFPPEKTVSSSLSSLSGKTVPCPLSPVP